MRIAFASVLATCQEKEFEQCEYELEADCEASCEAEGALFCDGEYVRSGAELGDCIAALAAIGLEGIEAEVFAPDENTRILQGLRVSVREAYAHCPRAFTFSRLWDTQTIQTARDAKANRYWLDRWREGLKEPMEI